MTSWRLEAYTNRQPTDTLAWGKANAVTRSIPGVRTQT